MFEFVFCFCDYNIITFLLFLSSSKPSHLPIPALIQTHSFFFYWYCIYVWINTYTYTIYISKYNLLSFYDVTQMFAFMTDLLLTGNHQPTCFSLKRRFFSFSTLLSCLQFFMQYKVVCGFPRICKLSIALGDDTSSFCNGIWILQNLVENWYIYLFY